jgi:hypothetical protein
VLGTADEAVGVIGLPEGMQGAEAGLVDETARNGFLALERVGEGFAVAEGEERMDVIGHDDVAPEVVALAVEVMEAIGDDDWGEAWITQGAGAVRGVEVFVELVVERAVVAGFGDVVPRRQIRGEEGLAGLVSEASAKDEREASRRGVHAAAYRRGGRRRRGWILGILQWDSPVPLWTIDNGAMKISLVRRLPCCQKMCS